MYDIVSEIAEDWAVTQNVPSSFMPYIPYVRDFHEAEMHHTHG